MKDEWKKKLLGMDVEETPGEADPQELMDMLGQKLREMLAGADDGPKQGPKPAVRLSMDLGVDCDPEFEGRRETMLWGAQECMRLVNSSTIITDEVERNSVWASVTSLFISKLSRAWASAAQSYNMGMNPSESHTSEQQHEVLTILSKIWIGMYEARERGEL